MINAGLRTVIFFMGLPAGALRTYPVDSLKLYPDFTAERHSLVRSETVPK
jgi:hypothetical protein